MFLFQTALKDLRQRARDPLSLALWIGIPLAIGTLISLAFGGAGDSKGPTAEILVVDQDESIVSEFLKRALGSGSAGDGPDLPFVAEQVGLEEGHARIEDGDATALLIIPANFAEAVLRREPCTLELITNPAQRILPKMVVESLQMLVEGVFYVHQVFGEPIERLTEIIDAVEDRADNGPSNLEVTEIALLVNGVMRRSSDLLFPPAIEFQTEITEADEEEGTVGFAEFFFPSMLFMALFFMAQGLSEDVWVEKQQGTLRRALVTPHGAGAFLGGKLLGAAVLISLVSAVGLAAGSYVLGLQLSNLVLAAVWAAFSGAFLVLLMLPLQLIASSQRAGSLLSNLVMMPLLMLGGSFFPFEVMPDGMAAIGRWTPNGWALSTFKEILLDQVELGGLMISLAGLSCVGGVLFLISTRRLAGAFARN